MTAGCLIYLGCKGYRARGCEKIDRTKGCSQLCVLLIRCLYLVAGSVLIGIGILQYESNGILCCANRH